MEYHINFTLHLAEEAHYLVKSSAATDTVGSVDVFFTYRVGIPRLHFMLPLDLTYPNS